jgi:hypothetical protein
MVALIVDSMLCIHAWILELSCIGQADVVSLHARNKMKPLEA